MEKLILWNNGFIKVHFDYSPEEKETNFKGSFKINAVEYEGINITALFDDNDFDKMEDKIFEL